MLTRNKRLSQERGIKVIVVANDHIKEQLRQVLEALNITPSSDMMFTRCTICNEELKAIEKARLKEIVPEYVFNTQEHFFLCEKCQRAYWQGTHWGNVGNIIKEIASL